MFLFRMRMRDNLPLIYVVLNLFLILQAFYLYKDLIQSYMTIFIVFFGEVVIISTGLSLFMFISRKKDDWMIVNIAYFFIAMMFLEVFSLFWGYLRFIRSFDDFDSQFFFVLIPYLISLAVLILTYEKGILKNLFSQRSVVIDRLFFSYLLFRTVVITIFSAYQMWDFLSNLTGIGRISNGLQMYILLFIILILPFVINWLKEDMRILTLHFNTFYTVFIIFVLIVYDTFKYLSSLINLIGENDPFNWWDYITSIQIAGLSTTLILYIVLKSVCWKSYASNLDFTEGLNAANITTE